MRRDDRNEPRPRRRGPSLLGTLAGLTAIVAVGCSDDALGPGDDGTGVRFSEEIRFPTFQDEISTQRARVEIKLIRGTLTAREVEIEEPEDMADREEVESRVTAIQAAGGAGTLTLALGGLQIDFDAATEFRREDDRNLSFDAFVTAVQDALAAGRNPPIEAKRNPAAEPQAPDDPTFFATRLELDDEADEPEIEINVDADNLIGNDAPPPDAFLRVLGLDIEIRASGGVTELERERDDDFEKAEFEGVVSTVDVAAGTATLTNGTAIRLIGETEIDSDGGDEDELASLEEVEVALAAGLIVEAEGEGDVESTDPLTIVAKEVEFEVEDDADDVPDDVEFEGLVALVDVAGGIVTLSSGTIVQVVAATEIEGEDDDDDDGEELGSLEEVEAALGQGLSVEAEGEGDLVAMDPRTIVAAEIEFEIEDDS